MEAVCRKVLLRLSQRCMAGAFNRWAEMAQEAKEMQDALEAAHERFLARIREVEALFLLHNASAAP